nr:recombinase family protein [uncultured Pseudomonas sp.]
MPVAHSYIRFSSAQQAQGDSKARQEKAIKAWRDANPSYELSDLKFEDLGVSGYSGDHLKNGFGKLQAAIEHGDIKAGDRIIIEAIDRAGRLPPAKMLEILLKIVNAGVTMETLDDGVIYDNDPRSSNNLFLLVAKVQQAHQYSDALSNRIKGVYERKREKAAKGGGVKRRTPVWLTKDGKLIDDVAPFIVQAFEDYAAGIGERRIHRRIFGQHPLLSKLSPGTIKKWFRNPTAIGRWGEIEDVYPAVVSKELYFRVQKRLEETYRKKPAAQKYLLTGLVFCGVCGNTMGVQSFGERSPSVMQCTKRIRLGELGCTNNRSIPYMLLDYIRSQTSHSALQRAVTSQRLTASEKRTIEIDGELKELHKQSESVASALVKFGMLPAIEAELEKIRDAIQALETEKATLPTITAHLDDVIEVENDFLDTDFMKLNALLQSVDYRIVCTGTTITVEEQSFGDGAERQTYVYQGVHRPTGTYRFLAPSGDVWEMPVRWKPEDDIPAERLSLEDVEKQFPDAVVTEDEHGNITVNFKQQHE